MAQLKHELKVRLEVGFTEVLEIFDEELWLALYIKYRGLKGGISVQDIINQNLPKCTPQNFDKKAFEKSRRQQNSEIRDWIAKNRITRVHEIKKQYPDMTSGRAAGLLLGTRRHIQAVARKNARIREEKEFGVKL